MTCYFDGSAGADDAGSQWLTLAGYMASDSFWASFQTKWETMLRARYPIAPWLHMIELFGHEDPFERVNGWTDDKIGTLIWDALDLLQNLDKSAFRAFVYSIDVTAHKRLLEEGYKIGDPSTICAHSCIKASTDWYLKNHKIELVYIFYDRGETFFESVRKSWLASQTHKKKVYSSDDPWALVANVHDATMTVTPPIQAADLIAWARTRELSNRERPYRYLAHIARQVIPHSFWKLDEERMRQLYTKQGP